MEQNKPTGVEKVSFTVRLPAYIVEWLRVQDVSGAALIITALKSQYKLTPPTPRNPVGRPPSRVEVV